MFTAKKGKTVTPSRRFQAKGEMCTLQTGKLCYNAIDINYVHNVWSYAELQESQSIFLLSWSFVKEFAVSSYRWSYAQLCMLTQDKSTKLWEPWHILQNRIGVSLVKSLNQGLWPISLHLISKRIKEILTQNTKIMRNIYPSLMSLMVKMFSGNKKNLYISSRFQLYA